MSKSKKLTSLVFAIVFAFLTCGLGVFVLLPNFANKTIDEKSTVRAADPSVEISASGLASTTIDGQTFYIISSANDLADVAYAVSYRRDASWASANYVLAGDIDLSGQLWTPIGTDTVPFTGRFNGNGYTISGIISPDSASLDNLHFGLFGKVSGGAIYDVVIDEFAYSYTGGTSTIYSGRLAGYVENAVLADIYDMAFVSFPSSVLSEIQTFGDIGNGVTIYAGDSFTHEGNIYTPANYNANIGSVQFNYASISGGLNIVGKSIYVVDDETGIIYKHGDADKTDIGSYRILVSSDGSVVDNATVGLYSEKYRTELPKTVDAESFVEGDLIIEGVALGKKMLGLKNGMDSAESPTYYNNIAGYLAGVPESLKNYNFIVADWKDLSYNITVYTGFNDPSNPEQELTATESLSYNQSWSELADMLQTLPGYSLLKLTETRGGDDVIYEAIIEWDKDYINKEITATYPQGETAVQWDQDGLNEINVALYAEWQGEPVNTVVAFGNSNDAKASLDAMTNLSAVYTNTDFADETISIIENGTTNGQYTFRAFADEEVKFSFKLNSGYEIVGTPTISGGAGGADSFLTSTPTISYEYDAGSGIHTITVDGIISADATINVEIRRSTISIPVTAENFTLALSGHDSTQTSISGSDGNYVITTKVEETFNLNATIVGNYEYDTYQVNDLTQVNSPTGDDNVKTFAIDVTTIGEDPSITIVAKSRVFTASLTFDYQTYSNDANAKPGTISIRSGSQTVSTGENASWNNLIVSDSVTITVTNNAYYQISNLSLTGTEGALLTQQDETTWILSGIASAGEYQITATFAKVNYTATYTGGFPFSGSVANPILDAEGNPITDADELASIISFEGLTTTYNYGDQLQLKLNLISQYYEFVGWYYSNGTVVSLEEKYTIASAPASNLGIYAVVRGKTTTVTISNGTYYELDGSVHDAGKNLATVANGVSQITFTYAQPDSGSFSLQLLAGYGLSRVLIGPSSADIANGTTGFYTFGTGATSFSGYRAALAENEEILNMFTQTGWHIEILSAPYSAQVTFTAGEGATGNNVSLTYYYDQPIDVTEIMAGFAKTGHTPVGWSFALSGNNYTVQDSSLTEDQANYFLDFANFNGITNVVSADGTNTITVTRTYNANTYKINFKLGEGESIADDSLLQGSAEEGWFINVVYGQPIGTLPTAEKTGYNFNGWQIGSTGIDAETVFDYTENQNASAVFNKKGYDLRVYANGGTITQSGDVSPDGTYFMGEVPYGTNLGDMVSSTIEAGKVSREGYEIESLNYVVQTQTADGPVYELKVEISDDTIFNTTFFTDFNFDDESAILTLYIKWAFAADEPNIDSITQFTGTYGNMANPSFEVRVGFNEATYTINSTSTSLPSDSGIALSEATWEYGGADGSSWQPFEGSSNAYSIDVANVSQSGQYRLTYTIKDQVSIPVLAAEKQITATTTVTINPGKIDFEFDTSACEPFFFYPAYFTAKEILSYNQPILELLEDDSELVQRFVSLNSWQDYLAWLSDAETQGSLIKVTLKTLLTLVLADKDQAQAFKDAYAAAFEGIVEGAPAAETFNSFIDNLSIDWIKANVTDTGDSTDPSLLAYFSLASSAMPYYTEINSDANIWKDNVSVTDANVTSAEIVTILPDSFTGENIFTEISQNSNAGLHYVAFKLTVADTFDISNYADVSEIDGEYYVVFTKEYLAGLEIRFGDEIFPPVLYAPATVLNMSENTGIEGESYTFTLTCEDVPGQEFERIVATVQPNSTAAGTYSFLEGNLLVTEYRAYTSETEYYTVQRQEDGSYKAIGATSDDLKLEDFVPANISLFVNGDFVVIDESGYEAYDFGSSYLSATAGGSANLTATNIVDVSGYEITINSVTVQVGGNSQVIQTNGESGSFYHNGTFVFQIKGNAASPILYATPSVVNVTLSVASLTPQENRHFIGFLPWVEGNASSYETALRTLQQFPSSTQVTLPIEVTTGQQTATAYNAIYTDAAYVTFSSVSDTGAALNSGFVNNSVFAPIGGQLTMNDGGVDYDLYTFDVLAEVGGSAEVVGKQVTIPAKPTVALQATFGLANPIASVEPTTWNLAAFEGNYNFSEFENRVSVENDGAAAGITYSYQWFKGEESISTITANISNNGDYSVVVTANSSNFNSTSSEVEFKINFVKTSISLTAPQTTSETYKNASFMEDISFTWKASNTANPELDDTQQMTLAELYALNSLSSKTLVTTITKDRSQVVSDITDAGTYEITFAWASDTENVYDFTGAFSFTFTVNPHLVNLDGLDLDPLTKVYGSQDPELRMTIDGIGETFEVTFTNRGLGEDVGYYDLKGAQSQDPNYKVSLTEDGNRLFEITGIDGLALRAEVSGSISHVYDGTAPTSVTVVENAGTFQLVVSSEDQEWGGLNLGSFYHVAPDGEAVEDQNVTMASFSNITFSITGAGKDVGSYYITASGTNDNFEGGFIFANASAAKVDITAKELTLSNFTKQFDQTTSFDSRTENHNVSIQGLVEGESIDVTATFASADVTLLDATHAMSGISLVSTSTGLASNYSIDAGPHTGTITKSDKTISISLTGNTFTYGQLSKGDLSAIVLDGRVDDSSVYPSYVDFEISITSAVYSTGGFLNQGRWTLQVNATSDYYTVSNTTFEITVNKLSITATPNSEIVKDYDMDNIVEQSFTLNSVLLGDDVSASATYASEMPGQDIAVTITLSGADYANYQLESSNTTGVINSVTITVVADINNGETGFVDGAQAIGTTRFEITFPFTEDWTAQQAFDLITAPGKTGYRFAGWTYNQKAFNSGTIEEAFEGVLNGSREISITATWQIETYEITVNINDVKGTYLASPQGSVLGKVHTYDYWTTVTFTGTANNGYVLLSQPQTIEHVTQSQTININFRAARITFTIISDTSGLYPSGAKVEYVDTEKNWTDGGSNIVTRSTTFDDESMSNSAITFLTEAKLKGYDFTGWSLGDTFIATNSEMTLADLVAEAFASFTNDISINLTTNFAAKPHQISFDLNYEDAALEPEAPEAIDVTYGQAVGELPTVEREGYNFLGWVYGEETFSSSTIYAYDEDITLSAEWAVGVYSLTVTTDHVSITITEQESGDPVTSTGGGVYWLDHEHTYNITVQVAAGYTINPDWTESAGYDLQVAENGLSATLSNITANGTLSISATPNVNTINVQINHATITVEVADSVVSADEEDNGYSFTASTGQTVEITVLPEAGYTVTFTSNDHGRVTPGENGLYTLTNFTQNVNLVFTASANTFTATVSLDAGITGFEIISGGVRAGATSITVSTGTPLVIKPLFATGYQLASNGATATTGIDVVVNDDGTITFTNFTDSFGITLTSSPINYNMNASYKAVDSQNMVVEDASGFEVSTSPSGSAAFGTDVTFTASMGDNQGYIFVGWFEGALQEDEFGHIDLDALQPVSTDLSYSFTVTGERTLTAVFKFSVFTVTAQVSGHGEIYRMVEGEPVLVADSDAGTSMSEELFFNEVLELNAVAKPGYQFDGWYIGEGRVETNATYQTTITGALALTARFSPKPLEFDINPGVMINGNLYQGQAISGLNFGTIEWSADPTFADPEQVSSENPVQTVTDGSVYIRITVNTGYSFDSIYSALEGFDGQINERSHEENVFVFEITKLNADHEGGYEFNATFVAEITTINLVFSDGEYQVEAGQITVSSEGIGVSGNNSAAVTVSAPTDTSFTVNAYVRLGLKFADGDRPAGVQAGGATISDQIKSTPKTSTGWGEQLTFTVSGYTSGTVTIYINVDRKEYNVQLVNVNADGSTSTLGDPFTVEYGRALVVPTDVLLSLVREGYTFTGFYAYVNGAGRQYIDANGNAVGNWTDNGYIYYGGQYVVADNFKEKSQTFTLYANYIINKTHIVINTVPVGLENIDPTTAASVVIGGMNESNSWLSPTDIFVADIREGASIRVTAPEYENYRFVYWKITRTDSTGAMITEQIESSTIDNFAHDGYEEISLELVYYAKVGVSVERGVGGTASFTYRAESGEEITVEGSEYIPTTGSITLNAVANPGYSFAGWFDAEGSLLSTQASYPISADSENPIYAGSYVARFTAATVTIKIGEYDHTNGQITSVRIGTNYIDDFENENGFSAQIGQSIWIEVEKYDDNFEVTWTGGNVKNFAFSYYYVVSYDDLSNGAITLTPRIDYTECEVTITFGMTNGDSASETSYAAEVSYVDTEGNVIPIDVEKGVTFQYTAGGRLQLQFNIRQNYYLAAVYVNGENVFEGLEGNSVYVTINPRYEIGNGRVAIQVVFARDLWVDTVDETYQLQGEGTDSNPYIISSQSDLAFVAHMINEAGSVEYANAVYVVEDDINMTGRYWSPIGTQENMFNGKFYYRNHNITGIDVVYGYSGEYSRDGVFGYVTSNAEIQLTENDYTLAIIIICVVVVLIIIALVLFFVLRAKRKKKLEELANS